LKIAVAHREANGHVAAAESHALVTICDEPSRADGPAIGSLGCRDLLPSGFLLHGALL
jgi:hypothetical protein